MNTKSWPVILFFLPLTLLFAQGAFGADITPPDLTKQFEIITKPFSAAMIQKGGELLFAGALLQAILTGFRLLLKDHDFGPAFWGQVIVWPTITLFFFFTLIQQAPSWMYQLTNGFNAMGGSAAGTGRLDPMTIMSIGLDLVESIRSAMNEKAGVSLIDLARAVLISFQVIFVQFFVLICFLILAGQMALLIIKAYLWTCLAPLLLGLGGLKFTRDIAVNVLKAPLAIGVSLLTIYVIAGVTVQAVGLWNSLILAFTMDNWMPMWWIVVTAAMLAFAAWNVPKIASDFINGTISGGVGEVTGAALGAAGMAAGAAGLAVGAASAVAGTGSGVAGAAGGSGAMSASDIVSRYTSGSVSPGGGATGGDDRSLEPGAGGPLFGNPNAHSNDPVRQAMARKAERDAAQGENNMGNASSAGFDAPGGAKDEPSKRPLSERVQDGIRRTREHMPGEGDATVGVNANLRDEG